MNYFLKDFSLSCIQLVSGAKSLIIKPAAIVTPKIKPTQVIFLPLQRKQLNFDQMMLTHPEITLNTSAPAVMKQEGPFTFRRNIGFTLRMVINMLLPLNNLQRYIYINYE